MTKKIVFYIIIAVVYSSCGSYKNIPYFQDLNHSAATAELVQNYSPLTIQPADILGINVSARNPEAAVVFNYNLNRANGSVYDASAENPIVGYLVDENGEIHLPLIGSLKVSGMTTSNLREKLNVMIATYYKDPVVNIRILNFKVSIFGDVQRPGIYTIQNERITITEALSLAGDLNITAMRNNVMLIREQDGKRDYIPVDLTSKKLFTSPYFYLKNNDEIYIQPDRTKYATVDRGYRISTLILGGLSVIAIVVSSIIYSKR